MNGPVDLAFDPNNQFLYFSEINRSDDYYQTQTIRRVDVRTQKVDFLVGNQTFSYGPYGWNSGYVE